MLSNTFVISWVELNKKAFLSNFNQIQKVVGSEVTVAGAVKANAYGHGLIESAHLLQQKKTWLAVNSVDEAMNLRKANIRSPLYIMGYVLRNQLSDVVACDARLVVYNRETIEDLEKAAKKIKKNVFVHMKVETGNNRQGIPLSEVVRFAQFIQKKTHVKLEGIATHFANIEDINPGDALKFLSDERKNDTLQMTSFPAQQLARFKEAQELLKRAGISVPLMHCANSAATILFPQTHFSMVRPGIALYGLWPSKDTQYFSKKLHPEFHLEPVLSWRTRIAQIKEVPKDQFIGYGCTFRTKKKTKIAILPIGYYDGFDRGLSNTGSVLIRGKRAPVVGRVCMNITMVDVTRIPGAQIEDTVTLIGTDGKKTISAEEMAQHCGTINYEVTTRINESIPRIVV